MSGVEISVRVAEIEQATPTIRRFRLARTDGGTLPPFAAGCHVVVLMPSQDRTIRNAYSLIDRAEDGSSYRIGVLRTQDSRGRLALHARKRHRWQRAQDHDAGELVPLVPARAPASACSRRYRHHANATPWRRSFGERAPTIKSITPSAAKSTAHSSRNCARIILTG